MPDVVIAGAGPAGAVAAIVLARAGARVLVLDSARFPRSKLCGDTLNPGALAFLNRLGLGHVADGGLRVDGMILTGGSVTITGRYEGLAGRALTRQVLDAALVSEARAAGATVDEGVLVTGPVMDEGREVRVRGLLVRGRDGRAVRISAPLVIAADGRASRVARSLGLSRFAVRPRRWAIGAYFHDVAGLSSFGEMHVRCGHYIGVAPLPDAVANACVVTTASAALRDPTSFLMSVLRTDARLSERFAVARLAGPAVSLGPLAVECRVAGLPGLLLAGDVAGFVDPMTGDGLRLAFVGAEQAARAAVRALAGASSEPHEDLRAARQEAFARKWRFNRALRTLVGSPAAVRAATIGATLAPGVLTRVIRYAGDCADATGVPDERPLKRLAAGDPVTAAGESRLHSTMRRP